MKGHFCCSPPQECPNSLSKNFNKQEVYTMTMRNKQELIQQVVNLLNALIGVEELPTAPSPSINEQVEMLTIKECCSAVKGLNEYTVRQLVARNEIPFVRCGQGKRGKILIPKAALIAYFSGRKE